MIERGPRKSGLVVTLLALLVATPAAGQSLFATRGLGIPLAAVDARARALGSIGIGLAGLSTSLANPAETAGLTRSGVTAALQPSSGTAEIDGATGDIAGARFPLAHIMFPLSSRVVSSIGYGSVYEQSWAIRSEHAEIIGGQPIDVTDLIDSSGGLAEVGIGLAWAATPSLALGVTGGIYTGNLRRTVTRTFPDSLTDLEPFRQELSWEYRAPFVRAGFRFDPAPIVRLGAAVTWGGDLDVDADAGEGDDEKAAMPLRLAAGISGFLADDLMLALAAERSVQDEGAVFGAGRSSPSLVRSTWRVGGGVEWGGLGSGARSWPIRLGATWAQLPFHGTGETPAEERSYTGGVGFRLAGDPSNPQAVLDATLERGERTGFESDDRPAGLRERFWRFTISLSLFGR